MFHRRVDEDYVRSFLFRDSQHRLSSFVAAILRPRAAPQVRAQRVHHADGHVHLSKIGSEGVLRDKKNNWDTMTLSDLGKLPCAPAEDN